MVPLNATVAPSAEWRVVQYSDTFRHKLLDTERSVTSNTVTMEEPNIGHSPALCLHATSRNQMSATVNVPHYTQLRLTSREYLSIKTI